MLFPRLGRIWPNGPTLGVVAAAGLLLVMFASNVVRIADTYIEWPAGCDDYGYLRQARLFQEKGWIGGLDTRIADPQSLYLVDKIRALGAPPEAWNQGVAPHCHHYKERTQRIVLQYPPGTGFVLSFFDAGVQARSAFMLHNFLVLAILLLVCAGARTLAGPLLIVVLGVFVFRGMYFFRFNMSILPSTAAALAAGYLTVAASASTGGRRLGLLALLGFVIGIAASFRLPNLFWVVGPLAVLGVLFLRRPSWDSFAAPTAFGLGGLAGLLPVLAAQAINAGHPLATTYDAADATPPQLQWDVLVDGLRFYFVENQSQAALVVVAAAAIAAVLLLRGTGQAAAMGAVSLAFTLAYMLLHYPRIAYYLFPAATYAMAVAIFAVLRSENARVPAAPMARARLAAVAATLAASFALTRPLPMPVSPDFARPNVTAEFAPRAIVWADLTSGPVSYFLRRQAAKLPILDAALWQPVMAAIERDGVPQVLVVDSDATREAAERIGGWARLRPAGQVFGRDAFRLEFGPEIKPETPPAPQPEAK